MKVGREMGTVQSLVRQMSNIFIVPLMFNNPLTHKDFVLNLIITWRSCGMSISADGIISWCNLLQSI